MRSGDSIGGNVWSRGKVDINTIFANPIYARLIGGFEDVNAKFEGRLRVR